MPTCGVLWGAYTPPGTGQTLTSVVTDLESKIGQKFDIVYRYQDFSSTGPGVWPDTSEKQLSAGGRVVMVDWEPMLFTSHQDIPWTLITAGDYDSVIDAEAARVKAFKKPILINFEAEMDRDIHAGQGTPAQYAAAFRYVHQRFAAKGVTNAVWVWTTQGYSANFGEYKAFYPGSQYVDWIGWDPYNFAACHSNGPFRTFEEKASSMYDWLESNGFGAKPFILPEYGTVPGTGSQAAQWFDGVPDGLAALPNIKGLVEFNDGSGSCGTTLTAPGELAAFAAAGRQVEN